MNQDDSAVVGEASLFCCRKCGKRPTVVVVDETVTLVCTDCEVQEAYGDGRGRVRAGNPAE